MSVIVYALVIVSGIAAAVAIYLCILAIVIPPSPKHSQVARQVAPANGARGAGAPSNEAARAPLFTVDPLDEEMVLPAAWPADNVTDINGRPIFIGHSLGRVS